MKPYWVSKIDPKHYPVRFLAHEWQQRTGIWFSPKEQGKRHGQLRDLRKALGDLTQYVIEWMLNPVNWYRFSQQVRAEAKLYRVPDNADLDFLLRHRNRALRIMRRELRNSTAPADVNFCTKLDRLRYEQWKSLLLVLADSIPERLAKIEAAETLTDMQRVFIELVDAECPVQPTAIG